MGVSSTAEIAGVVTVGSSVGSVVAVGAGVSLGNGVGGGSVAVGGGVSLGTGVSGGVVGVLLGKMGAGVSEGITMTVGT